MSRRGSRTGPCSIGCRRSEPRGRKRVAAQPQPARSMDTLCGASAAGSVAYQIPAVVTPHNHSHHISLPAVSRPAGRLMPQKAGGACRGRRVQAVRVPGAARGRLPLPAVPRRPQRRARPEAAGRHRRRSHRRVRGQARDRAPRKQPRHGHIAVERPAEASGDCGILVAAAGSGTEGGTRVGALAVGFGLEIQAPLAAATEARRLRSARLRLSDAPGSRLRRGAARQGRRVPSAQQALLRAASAPPRWRAGWRSRPLQRQFCAMTRRFRAALLPRPPSLPRAASTTDPPQRGAPRCGRDQHVPRVTS